MSETDGFRLKKWRKSKGLSQRDLASQLGRSQGFVGNIEADKTGLSRDLIARMADRTSVNVSWLLTGNGDMDTDKLDQGFEAGGNTGRIEPPNYQRPLSGDFASGSEEFNLIRRTDIGEPAGLGSIPVETTEVDNIAVTRSWLRKRNLAADLCVLVKVHDDSMAPTIPNGSLVLVDAADMRGIREGIYAFNREGEFHIKRLVPVGLTKDDKPAALVIVGDNPAITPETISGEGLSDFRIVGRVRCVISDL